MAYKTDRFDKVDYAQILFMQIERCAKSKTMGVINEFIESVDLLEALLPYCERNKEYNKEITLLDHKNTAVIGNIDSLPKRQRQTLQTQKQSDSMNYYFGKFRALIRYADNKGLLVFKVVSDFNE